MSRRTIGIDVSGSSIKAVELVYSRMGAEVTSFFNGKLKDEEVPEEFTNVLRSKVTRGTRVVSAIPAGQVILRSAVVPFRDEKRIRQIVKFEAERYLPFPAEEAVVDFYIVGPEKQGGCRIMLVTVRRAFLEKHVSFLKGLGVEPGVVDVDSIALLNLLGDERGTVAIVDLGAEVGSIGIVSQCLPFYLRTIPVSGDSLTKVLADGEGISWEEAEERKINGEIGSAALEEAMDSIVNELKYTIGAFSLQEPNAGIEKILLSGGGAKLENLPEFLKERLGIDAAHIDPLKELRHKLSEDLVSQVQGCGDVAVGLALRGVKGKAEKVSLNFKGGGLGRAARGKDFVTMAVLISAAVLLGISTVFLRLHWGRSHLCGLEREIRTIFAETFPGEKERARSSLEMISLLRQRVDDGRSRLNAAGELGTGSMLDMLRELMVSIPDSVSVDITDIRLDGNSIRIEGKADSFKTVEKLLQNLSASGCFEDVRVKQADSLHGRVTFRVDIVK